MIHLPRMTSITYQSSNILENLYTDGVYSYVYTTTLYNQQQQFNSIITYCNSVIPTWKPCYGNPTNRLAFNTDFLYEIIFYKNLIMVIPLYISSLQKLEASISHIKNYCQKLTNSEDSLDNSLSKLIDYKFIFYSPKHNFNTFKINVFRTNQTLHKWPLFIEFYQSIPIPLNTTNPILVNMGANPMVAINPVYMPYNPMYYNTQNTQNTQNTKNAQNANNIPTHMQF